MTTEIQPPPEKSPSMWLLVVDDTAVNRELVKLMLEPLRLHISAFRRVQRPDQARRRSCGVARNRSKAYGGV